MHTSNKNINAVEMLAEQIVKATQSHTHAYDQTFSSVIKAVNNDGTYNIIDNGGAERKLKCSALNTALKIGQYVWVKIPCGRLEDMHICGLK